MSWNTKYRQMNENQLFFAPDSTEEVDIQHGNGIRAGTTYEELVKTLNVSNRARLLKIELFLPRLFQYFKKCFTYIRITQAMDETEYPLDNTVGKIPTIADTQFLQTHLKSEWFSEKEMERLTNT